MEPITDMDGFDFDEELPQAPTEGDITTTDHRKFYQDGKLILELADLNDNLMWEKLEEHMLNQGFFPDVWFISDHGNCELLRRRS